MDHTRAEALLSPYLDSQVTGAARADIEAHLASCPTCQATLEAYQAIDRRVSRLRGRGPSIPVAPDVMRILRGGKPVAASRPRRRAWLLAPLLVLLIVAAGGVYALSARGNKTGPAVGGAVYVALQDNDGAVAVVDVQSQKLIDTIVLGFRPLSLAMPRDGSRIYVLADRPSISVIDVEKKLVVDRFALDGRAGGMAVAPDGKTLYLTMSGSRSLVMIDSADGRRSAEIRVGRSPREVIVSPDGQWLFVYNGGDNTVSRIRTSTKQETRLYRLLRRGEGTAEFALHPMALTPDGRHLFISEVNRERIWSIDLTNDEVKAIDVPMRNLSRDMAVSPDGSRLFVVHGDPRNTQSSGPGLASMALPKVERSAEIRGYYSAITLSPDGATIFASSPDENSIIVVSSTTLETLATIPVGQQPAAVVYNARP